MLAYVYINSTFGLECINILRFENIELACIGYVAVCGLI